MQLLQDKVRYEITRYIFENGFAPDVEELAELMRLGDDVIKKEFRNLADNRALVLHPNSYKVWVAHPFALFPTLFWVQSGERRWWGNCIWCSLGIAALTRMNTCIHTKIAGEDEPVRIHIEDGRVLESDLLVHFPIEARKLWDNVLFSCSSMLVFKSEADIASWCIRHGIIMGEAQRLAKVWELAKLWYGNYLSPSWTRKTPEIAEALFRKVGLEGDFWKMSG